MSEILRRPDAETDLDQLWLFIAQDDPVNADRFLDRVADTCALLGDNPLMGRSRPELAPDLRSFPVGGYLIFYQPLDDGIEIVRIISAARVVDALF